MPGIRCRLFGKCLHIGLHFLADILPSLVHFTFPVVLLIFRPVLVIIHCKFPDHALQFPVRKLPSHKRSIYFFRSKYPNLLFQIPVGSLSEPGLAFSDIWQIPVIDHGFHRDIRCQIPQRFLPAISAKYVPENAMQYQMQIRTVYPDPILPVLTAQHLPVKIHRFSICGKNIYRKILYIVKR